MAELGQIFGYHIRHIEEEPSHQLQQDLMDFIDLVPFEDVQRLMQYYYHYDVEVESAFDYVSTEDYTQIRLDIVNLGEVRSFRRYLDSIGFSVEKVWSELNKRFDADDIFAEPDESVRMSSVTSHTEITKWYTSVRCQQFLEKAFLYFGDNTFGRALAFGSYNDDHMKHGNTVTEEIQLNLTTRGLNGLVDDILALLPQDEIILLFFDKLETSNDFSFFFEQIGSGEFENVLNMLQSSQQLRILLWRLQRHGFDIPGWIQLVQKYFSFSSF
uniref:Uncharacterized protein n=1 Tax=Anopheles culicifacies TaxID=139723 RepID=A0A182MUJ6_9DIPT